MTDVTNRRPWLQDIDYRARCYVHGTRRSEKTGQIDPAYGEWAAHFLPLPLVREAEANAWGHELRSFAIFGAKRRLFDGRKLDDPRALMPQDEGWLTYQRQQAHKYKLASAWREQNAPPANGIPGLIRRLFPELSKRFGQ